MASRNVIEDSPSLPAETNETLLARFPQLVRDTIKAHREDQTPAIPGVRPEYDITGVVIAGTEEGELIGSFGDVDLFILSTDGPRYHDLSLLARLNAQVDNQHSIHRAGGIRSVVGQPFTDDDWRRIAEDLGLPNAPYQIILTA